MLTALSPSWDHQLQQDKEALEMKVKALSEMMKKREGENSNLTQSLAAVQAVNQASSDKLAKVRWL
jgi:chaperonin cofactor prefoldin